MKKLALSFLLFLTIMVGITALHAQSAKDFFQNDRTLTWRTLVQGTIVNSGELRISKVTNNTFDAGQTNKNNPGAGTQTMYGGIFNGDQQVVLLNVGDYREVWIGTITGDRITGKIQGSGTDFEINQPRLKPYEWVAFSDDMPENVVNGGFENGVDLAVCRTFYNGANHPGKVVGGGCNIGWGGKEIVSQTFEVLINQDDRPLRWVNYTGSIPERAVVAGTEGERKYYVGQFTRADGSIQVGKVFGTPGNYIFNYGYGGNEITEKSNFRILVPEGK